MPYLHWKISIVISNLESKIEDISFRKNTLLTPSCSTPRVECIAPNWEDKVEDYRGIERDIKILISQFKQGPGKYIVTNNIYIC